MLVTVKFIGTLSTKFGNAKISMEIEPSNASLHAKIRQMIGADPVTPYVVLRAGKTLTDDSEPIKDQDEFLIFQPISGG